jgi:hypothetical protein
LPLLGSLQNRECFRLSSRKLNYKYLFGVDQIF